MNEYFCLYYPCRYIWKEKRYREAHSCMISIVDGKRHAKWITL